MADDKKGKFTVFYPSQMRGGEPCARTLPGVVTTWRFFATEFEARTFAAAFGFRYSLTLLPEPGVFTPAIDLPIAREGILNQDKADEERYRQRRIRASLERQSTPRRVPRRPSFYSRKG